MKLIAIVAICALLAGCGIRAPTPDTGREMRKVVSLDYCADQYVLGLADPEHITALSVDSTSSFSYLRQEAEAFDQVRPRAEDILLMKPDIVVRTYGGGANITSTLQRAGIEVVQIGYAGNLADVQSIISDTATALGQSEKGNEVITRMETRLATIPKKPDPPSVLYLTSKGAVAGTGTMIDDLIIAAGLKNFQQRPGWAMIPLEELVDKRPDIVATGFFETSDLVSDIWSSARHPVTKRLLGHTETVNLPGAWTACSAWFLLDAVEAMSRKAQNL